MHTIRWWQVCYGQRTLLRYCRTMVVVMVMVAWWRDLWTCKKMRWDTISDDWLKNVIDDKQTSLTWQTSDNCDNITNATTQQTLLIKHNFCLVLVGLGTTASSYANKPKQYKLHEDKCKTTVNRLQQSCRFQQLNSVQQINASKHILTLFQFWLICLPLMWSQTNDKVGYDAS